MKPNRRKYPNVAERITMFRAAWKKLAPSGSFAGMTLAEFETRVAAVQENIDRLVALDAEYAAALTGRKQAELEARGVLELVVNAVRGSLDFGPNSELYKALGYVPKGERRSGLRRGSPANGAGEAA